MTFPFLPQVDLTPADDNDTQLEILSSIARGIDAEQLDHLLHCRDAGEIWSRLQTALRKDT